MPPIPGQKGTSKKGKDARPSRSRNSTPSVAGIGPSIPLESSETPYLELPAKYLQTNAAEELSDVNIPDKIPSSKDLGLLVDILQRLNEVIQARDNICDQGMRKVSQLRKDIELDTREEERKKLLQRLAADEEEQSRSKSMKPKKKGNMEERPLTHGAHGLAPQDGSGECLATRDWNPTLTGTLGASGASRQKPSKKSADDGDSASSSLSPPETPTAGDLEERGNTATAIIDDSEDADERQPPPAPAVLNVKMFGDDPSTFPDPTVYEIRQVKPGMSEEEIKEIYNVKSYPHDDLHDLIPGTPPDRDFSTAKPSNQTQANTFATYLEPYFRPLAEEDLAFLRDRGDRATPFIMPRRGKRHYSEIWAEEDGVTIESQDKNRLPPNQPRGVMESMDDMIAETEAVSTGPVLSRLLAAMRPERRAPATEEKPTTNGLTNGDHPMNGEANGDFDHDKPSEPAPLPSATYMPESSTEAWKKAVHPKLDYGQVDERIKQELRHIGLLPPDVEPDYDAHYDDEIAARLRFLQAKLREQSINNGAKKARLMQLATDQMAHQEYTTIKEDLDSQVQGAYLKRTRTMGKSRKQKKPGGAGGGSHVVGAARPGIGDSVKMLMERRNRWTDTFSVIFEDERALTSVPRVKNEESSIFKQEAMADLLKKEKLNWDEDVEEE